jgi:predicted nucleic acid-binding protein
MTIPFLDTSIIIRHVTGDDPVKQAAAAALFDRLERAELSVAAPDTVIADSVYVLSSPKLYHMPRQEVAGVLTTLVRIPSFKVRNRRLVLRALAIYGTQNLDFGDAMLLAGMEQAAASDIYSYDEDFDAVTGVRRLEP